MTSSPSGAHVKSKDSPADTCTAAVMLIGNELLNGRTQDTNLAHIAGQLSERGISVAEARVIADRPELIVDTLNELREKHDFVFTTGGIGPTHDDITAENIAVAFNVPLITDPDAEQLLLAYFKSRDTEPNEARMRMARVPRGATLIDNPVSVAPGFNIDNVFVMAGVPKIMQAMLNNILPLLPDRGRTHSISVICNLPEGQLAAPLGGLQESYPDIEIGSYPGKKMELRRVSLVARGSNEKRLSELEQELLALVSRLDGEVYDSLEG